MDSDSEIGKPLAACDDIRPGDFTPNTESDDGGMLEQQEQIGHPVGTPFLDQLTLKRERLIVANQAQSPDFQGTGCHFSLETERAVTVNIKDGWHHLARAGRNDTSFSTHRSARSDA